MKDAKAIAHNLQSTSPQNQGIKKDKQEKVWAIKDYNKRNTRCMTNSKINEQKTSKKNKVLNEKEGTQKIPNEKY